MDAGKLLDAIRGLVIVVESDGTITDARGGFGGFLGIDVDALVGSNVFDFVPQRDADDLAHYFIENVDESEATIALPLPFRMSIFDGDGHAHPVDIIPTGEMVMAGDWRWTVLVVPVALNSSITRSLDLEMAGAPRAVVRSMLCEELRVDNTSYTNRWMLVDLGDPTAPEIAVARPDDQAIADAVSADVESDGWRPWDGVPRGTAAPLVVDEFPERTRSLMNERDWGRSIVAPVHLGERLVAAFMLVGAVPEEYDALAVKRNVADRISTLVRATAMLIARWNDQDALRIAATTDHLTGVLNRRELFAALDQERRSGSLLYIDIDDFKSVNDRFGHAVGDRVLIEVVERITSECRTEDVVGRVGGDEFVIALPGAGTGLALEIARRIIHRVAEPLQLETGPPAISVSVGHAVLGTGDALDTADHAMLRAKRSWRQLVSAVCDD